MMRGTLFLSAMKALFFFHSFHFFFVFFFTAQIRPSIIQVPVKAGFSVSGRACWFFESEGTEGRRDVHFLKKKQLVNDTCSARHK